MQTNQQIFTKVKNHLLGQMKRSMGTVPTHGYICFYQGKGNLKCAIGCLIPDDIYQKDMEGKSVTELLEEFPVVSTYLGSATQGRLIFLTRLQDIHDLEPPKVWKEKLKALAKEKRLKF